jgi:PKD repeat protein
MSNSFDNKIKEALDNFEMPYDAGAWAQLEQQLPAQTPPSGGTNSGLGWKLAALLVVVASVATTVWLTSSEKEEVAKAPAEAIQQTEHTETANNTKEAKTESTAPSSNESAEVVTNNNDEEFEDSATINVVEANVEGNDQVEEITKEDETPIEPNKPERVEKETKVESILDVKFLASSIVACAGDEVNFINESSNLDAKMNWDFGDGSTSSEINPTHSFVLPGTYTVTLVGSEELKQDDHSVTVVINPTPTPAFTSERKLAGFEAIPLYTFATAVQPNQNAVWTFTDGTRSTGNEATHLFRNKGEQTAQLTVTNSYGCSNTLTRDFNPEEFNLLAPSGFSPNADGLNETFIPEALPVMGIDFEMTITNPRTGDVVYRTENASAPWNGNLNNNGPKLEAGVYVWTVVLKENVLKNRVFNDKIHLTR